MYLNLSYKLNLTTFGNHSMLYPLLLIRTTVKIGLKECNAKLFFSFLFFCFFLKSFIYLKRAEASRKRLWFFLLFIFVKIFYFNFLFMMNTFMLLYFVVLWIKKTFYSLPKLYYYSLAFFKNWFFFVSSCKRLSFSGVSVRESGQITKSKDQNVLIKIFY